LGWHGPFDTKEAVTEFYNSQTKAHPDWKAPTDLKGAITNGISDVTGLPVDAKGFLGLPNLNWENLILRVAEILVGIVLIGVGVAHMSGNKTNIIVKALKVANK
jgi:hypothetical protein